MHRPQRLMDLARELTNRTVTGSVVWEPSDQGDTYVWSTPRGSVSVGLPADPIGRRYYQLVLRDEGGNRIDDLSASMPADVQTRLVLQQLWEAARASTGVVDAVIDSLLDELRSNE